jgi:multiple sugar transport system permease protein
MKLFTKMTQRERKEAWGAFFFLSPNLIGFLLFTSIPLLASLGLSFVNWDFIRSAQFAGLANFREMLGFSLDGGFKFNNPNFWQYLLNTIIIMAVIPFNILASLLLASLLNDKIRGLVIYRTSFFLPSFTAGIAIFVLWRWIYAPDFGLMNGFLNEIVFPVWNSTVGKFLGMLSIDVIAGKAPQWLNSTFWSKPALMIMNFWISAGGYNMILYLAALQAMPEELYEAARLDGAGRFKQFIHITWPLLKPATFFIVTMSIIQGLQGGFQQAYIMTGGGPAGSTTTIGYYIYQNAYLWQYMGKAASVAWILFLLVFIVTIINWKFGGKESQG